MVVFITSRYRLWTAIAIGCFETAVEVAGWYCYCGGIVAVAVIVVLLNPRRLKIVST